MFHQSQIFCVQLLKKGDWQKQMPTNPVKFKKSVTCKISKKSLPSSLVNLPST